MSTKKHSAQQAFAKDMGKEVHVREVHPFTLLVFKIF